MRDDKYGCIIGVVIMIVGLAITIGLTYLVMTSDLPNWVKFLLLH